MQLFHDFQFLLTDFLSSGGIDPRDFIQDSGPVYNEFHADSWFREPWNSISSLLFLVPVAFWTWKLRGQYSTYPIITSLLPLLFLNGVGSTLYHAFRSSEVALLMDWMPAFVMNLILSWYMWNKILRKPIFSAAVVLSFIGLAIIVVFSLTPYLGEQAGNLGYLFIGLAILLPSVIYLFKSHFYKWYLLLLTFLILGLALLFRSLDYPTPNPFPEILPQGTHFLWHITSALAVFSLGYYFKFIKDRELANAEVNSPVQ